MLNKNDMRMQYLLSHLPVCSGCRRQKWLWLGTFSRSTDHRLKISLMILEKSLHLRSVCWPRYTGTAHSQCGEYHCSTTWWRLFRKPCFFTLCYISIHL